MPTIIEIDKVHKVYDTGAVKVPALRGVTLSVLSGEFVAIIGAEAAGQIDVDEHYRLPGPPDVRSVPL